MMRLNTPLTQIDSSEQYSVGSRVQDRLGKEYIYLKGVVSTVVGSWVTYDELGVTTLLAADAIGDVGVAMAITVADKFGWYQIYGSAQAKIAASCAADVVIGRESADGTAGDGHAATGDDIFGCVSREATTAAAVATVQLNYPFVNDNSN